MAGNFTTYNNVEYFLRKIDCIKIYEIWVFRDYEVGLKYILKTQNYSEYGQPYISLLGTI